MRSISTSSNLTRNVLPLAHGPFTPVIAVSCIAALYFGREVLVPIALAVLMSFVLAPLVRFLQGWRIPRSIAVIAVVLVAFAAVSAAGGVLVSQVTQLAADLPGYQTTLRSKIRSLRGFAGSSGTLDRAAEVLQNLGKELDQPNNGLQPSTSSTGIAAGDVKPIPVEVRQPDPGALQTISAVIAPLIHPLATTGIVLIFVIFILFQREDLRNRLVRLAGAHDLPRTTAAIDDAGQRLSRLFLSQLALNAAFGVVIGVGLWFIGVPSAPLWGIMAMILRFVPFIGPVLAAVFPIILAAAVGPDWMMAVWTGALFVAVEGLVGQVIEPMIYSQSTGLSPVAVIVSATFWTWLWGPIGLLLATPLTVCLVVIGRHVDRLNFLAVMLGDKPVLSPPELLYQRMLAGDPMEAAEQARRFLKEQPLLAYYEDILVEGLKLAQADSQRGLLDPERMARIRDAVAEIVDDLSSHEDKPATVIEDKESPEGPLSQMARAEEILEASVGLDLRENWKVEKAVLCVPGLGLLDEAVAIILAQAIKKRGIGAGAEPSDALSLARIFSLPTKDVQLVCLCYIENATPAQMRYAIRRLRRKAPQADIIVTLLGNANDSEDKQDDLTISPENVLVSRSIRDTVEQIRGKSEATSLEEVREASGGVEEAPMLAARA